MYQTEFEEASSKNKVGHKENLDSSPQRVSSPVRKFEPQQTETKCEAEIGKSTSKAVRAKQSKGTDLNLSYSIFTPADKRVIVLIAAFTTLLPPLTGSMYYPVIPAMARSLHVSMNDIQLTVTAYLVVQGIAPSFVGNMSDETGRRPVLIGAFIIYIAGCVGAAFSYSYTILLVTRCIQSAGISGTISISLATVSDIVTSAERGTYYSYVQLGWMAGPAIGPIIGGLLSRFLGWKSIFWGLAIIASIVLIIMLLFMPETCRSLVGNGSYPSPKWNRPLLVRRCTAHENQSGDAPLTNDPLTPPPSRLQKTSKPRISPWSSLKLYKERENCLLLLYGGLIYASSYVVVATMPTQLQKQYTFNTVQISLCFLASGFGTIASVLATGRLLDWNFRRHAVRLGMEISKQKQQDLENFPIEITRLQVCLPGLLIAGISLVAYGWTLQARTSLVAPLIFLFLSSLGIASSYSGVNNLLMDLNRKTPGTASAAMNLSRCWMGAGGIALGSKVSDVAGPGWMTVAIVSSWIILSPFIFTVMRYGWRWRKQNASDCGP